MGSRNSIAAALGRKVVARLVVAGRTGGGHTFLGRETNDWGYIYAATRAWLRGRNPYDLPTLIASAQGDGVYWVDAPLGYSPSSAGLGLILAPGGLTYLRVVVLLMNLGALATICTLTLRMLPPAAGRERDVRAFVVAGMLGNPFTLHVIWMGQTALIVAALTLAGWYFGKMKDRWLLGGLLFALATLKPQIALLPLLWLLAERRFKLVAAAGVVAGLFTMPAMLVSGGPLGLIRDWSASLGRYFAEWNSSPLTGEQHVFGIQSTLAAVHIVTPSLAIIAVVGAVILFRARARATQADILGVLGGLTMLFLFAHDYDLAAIGPLFATAWVHFREPPGRGLLFVGGSALLGVPTALLRKIHAPLVVFHWRELIVLSILCAVFWRVVRGADERPRDADAAFRPAEP